MEQVHELEGLCAIFLTREDADLAVEHLAQEYGIDPAFIYVEPVEDQNSAGVETSGGDAVSGGPSHRRRLDAALNGAIQLTVSVRQESLPLLKKALHEGRAIDIQVF